MTPPLLPLPASCQCCIMVQTLDKRHSLTQRPPAPCQGYRPQGANPTRARTTRILWVLSQPAGQWQCEDSTKLVIKLYAWHRYGQSYAQADAAALGLRRMANFLLWATRQLHLGNLLYASDPVKPSGKRHYLNGPFADMKQGRENQRLRNFANGPHSQNVSSARSWPA